MAEVLVGIARGASPPEPMPRNEQPRAPVGSSEDRPASVATSRRSAEISIGLLGGFEVRSRGEVVSFPATARRLVAFLALATRPLARSYVSQSLWPDASERHAAGNLRTALWKIGHLDSLPIEVCGGQLALGTRIAVDYWRSVTLARQLLGHAESLEDPELDEQAFTQDLLPDWYEEWVVAERERYRQLRLHALEELCTEFVGRRRFAQAVQAGLAAVAGEPLRESATLVLVRVYLAEGNVGEAIRQYESFTHLLWDELKVSPSRAMTELVERLRRG